ncbi:MAG: class I SAM-dependent methyltransferase [Oscillospiraceae bacterium]|jgi:demethylmenaquinone methyltransferase/2-methoxy-6-polyprenyl-1,4-benzoquinol methylase|nr:class I SAM-dependent methyltransferase [Oscillospiraceae bacterium]
MMDRRALFNSRAASWDHAHTHDPDKIELMLSLSDLRQEMDFLDVGCGTGVLEPYLIAYNPRRVLAVDFAEKMIAIAREKIYDRRIEFVCADIYALFGPLADCCFLYNAYPHFDDPGRLISHIATLLRPCGRLTISHTRGKADGSFKGLTFCGAPVHPNQALVALMNPFFHVDATVDNNALFLISGIKRD